MFFWRRKVKQVDGLSPTTFVGPAPSRYGEVRARLYVNLSPKAPSGYPVGMFVIWRPTSSGVPDEAAIDALFDAVDPLASTMTSYWFDDGSGVARLALAAWLTRRRGFTRDDALRIAAPRSRLLTDAACARWFGG